MAFLEDKFVPTLTGESARRFLEEMERNDNMATHVLPDNFFDEFKAHLARSQKYVEEHKNCNRKLNEMRHEARGVKHSKGLY